MSELYFVSDRHVSYPSSVFIKMPIKNGLCLLLVLVLLQLIIISSKKQQNGNNSKKQQNVLKHQFPGQRDPELFLSIGNSQSPVSDKFTTHKYQEMYGLFMLPFIRQMRQTKQSIRFLEIGLGCNMNYGPGGSVKIWKELFNENDVIWEAEIDVRV